MHGCEGWEDDHDGKNEGMGIFFIRKKEKRKNCIKTELTVKRFKITPFKIIHSMNVRCGKNKMSKGDQGGG